MPTLTSLIDSAKVISENRFDAQLFLSWQSTAFMTLTNLFGPVHYYTRNFKLLTSETNERSLLVGDGLLIAAREMMTPQVQAI